MTPRSLVAIFTSGRRIGRAYPRSRRMLPPSPFPRFHATTVFPPSPCSHVPIALLAPQDRARPRRRASLPGTSLPSGSAARGGGRGRALRCNHPAASAPKWRDHAPEFPSPPGQRQYAPLRPRDNFRYDPSCPPGRCVACFRYSHTATLGHLVSLLRPHFCFLGARRFTPSPFFPGAFVPRPRFFLVGQRAGMTSNEF